MDHNHPPLVPIRFLLRLKHDLLFYSYSTQLKFLQSINFLPLIYWSFHCEYLRKDFSYLKKAF